MRAFFLAFVSLFFLPFLAAAQQADRPNTILVLDASGSMWGQIDGVNKVVIARNVIAEMLADMPDDQSLGLTVYGHRERGSCTDIETIVPAAPFTQDAILEAVNGINPRGRTPMTDAVVAAAQSLRHTEEAATVILVSDGIENCNPDPCAIAAELEASGVAFTAHVIGFDVASEPAARAQMQCIAEGTGGRFLTADNASELSAALEQVVQAPVTQPVQIQAIVQPGNTPPTRPVTWTLLAGNGTVLSDGTVGPAITVELEPGSYVARATRTEPDGPVGYQAAFNVIEGQTVPIFVPMPEILDTVAVTFTARVEPDMTVPGSPLNWTLFDAAGATLLGPVQAPGGNVALLPGDYRLQVERVAQGTVHEARFTVQPRTPQEVVIPLPALSVDVTFTARIGSADGELITDPVIWEVTPLATGPEVGTENPQITPLTRGAYRVVGYWTVQEQEKTADFVIIDQPREVVLIFDEPIPQATLTAPAEAPAGGVIEVGWTGPEEDGDFIAIRLPESEGFHRFANTTRITQGNPLNLLMPPAPGEYVIEYIRNDGRSPLASVPITVTEVTATLTAPATAGAGQVIEVGWTGPEYDGDFIGVRSPDRNDYHRFINSESIVRSRNNPLDLLMPVEPGEYVIEYIEGQGRTPLTAVSITITEVTASLTAPATASAGSSIEVGYTGPEYDGDFIGVRSPDRNDYHRFINSTAVQNGNPADLLMPFEPGTYLIEYIEGQDRTPLAAVEITVSAVAASITAPSTASAGSTIEVGFTGPEYRGDFIGVRDPGRTDYHRFINSAPVDRGNPASLLMPTEPGEYVIEYIENQGRTPLAAVSITISEVSASLTAPTTAAAGAVIEVGFTGPEYRGDFIAVRAPDSEGFHRFVNTVPADRGNPAQLLMPSQPGTYLIEYIENQDRSPLAAATITVSEVSASLTAPTMASVGQEIEIGWTGPDYRNDFIAIRRPESEGYHRFESSVNTSRGNPSRLTTPTEPGTYLIEYIEGQDRTTLAVAEIQISEVSATITAPASAPAASQIEVGWTGPNTDGDFIGIGPVGATGTALWTQFTYTREGNPVTLQLPSEPGDYVITYFLDADNTALTSVPITVSAVNASVTAPATAPAGSTIEVGWTGPNADNDYIGIGRVDADGGLQWENFVYTRNGNPVTLLLPATPGEYLIQYFLGLDNVSLTSVPITLSEVSASLTAPERAAAGSTIEIGWTGPNYQGDFVAIGHAGSVGSGRWESYAYTSTGNPVSVTLPAEPGPYMLRYFLGQDNAMLMEQEIILE